MSRHLTYVGWVRHPSWFVVATHCIQDLDGTAPVGAVGEICDYCDDYIVVDFSETGPTLCSPDEIEVAA